MKLLPRAILALAALLSAPFIEARERVSTIKFDVRDAQTGNPISSEVSIDGDPVTGVFALVPDAESTIALDVHADAGAAYSPRSVVFFLQFFTARSITIRIFLAPKSTVGAHNRASVSRAARFLNDANVDRALALLETINDETTVAMRQSQFGAYLYYNLWRAYFIHCTRKSGDYCNQANGMRESLIEMSEDNPGLMKRERIDIAAMNREAEQIEIHRHKLGWYRAIWDHGRGHYDESLESISQIIKAARSNPDLWEDLQLAKGDVLQFKARVELARQNAENSPQ